MVASRFWQVRCFFRGTTYTQSLRTENRAAAISLAKHFYHVKTAELYAAEAAQSEHRRRQQRETFASRVPAVLAEQAARVVRWRLHTSQPTHTEKSLGQKHLASVWHHSDCGH
jgi:hypothetical protein